MFCHSLPDRRAHKKSRTLLNIVSNNLTSVLLKQPLKINAKTGLREKSRFVQKFIPKGYNLLFIRFFISRNTIFYHLFRSFQNLCYHFQKLRKIVQFVKTPQIISQQLLIFSFQKNYSPDSLSLPEEVIWTNIHPV